MPTTEKLSRNSSISLLLAHLHNCTPEELTGVVDQDILQSKVKYLQKMTEQEFHACRERAFPDWQEQESQAYLLVPAEQAAGDFS